MTKNKQSLERLNPNSLLVCNLFYRECKGNDGVVKNDAKSLMNHFVEKHGWKMIPELAQRDIDENRKHPKTGKIMTVESYLKFIDVHPEEWWLDNEFHWRDTRNLHFLHMQNGKLRELRSYYHE